jgi:hypothetical protein
MTLSITATIVPGQGNASTNHAVLIPRIAARFPEVVKCKAFGTINVHLDQPLDRSRADFWTSHVPWIPVHLQGAERAQRLEAFGFIRIVLEYPVGGRRYAAWIILPEGSDLTYAEDRAEIIAGEFIAGVAYGRLCAIHLDHMPAQPAPPWFGQIYGKSIKR